MAELTDEPRKPDLGEEGNRLRAELRRETIARFARWRHTKHHERYAMSERESRAIVYGFNEGYALALAEGMRAGIQIGAEIGELKGKTPWDGVTRNNDPAFGMLVRMTNEEADQ